MGSEPPSQQWQGIDCNISSVITSDASMQGWGASCRGHKTGGGGPWSSIEGKNHINILELKAAKLTILTFCHLFPQVQAIRIKMDNMVTLSYLVKMGGTHNKVLSDLSKEIWDYLLGKGITITAEYLPGILNQEADSESRSVKDSSEWKLKTAVFQKVCQARGTPSIDLFASRLSHQVPEYMSWKLDPYSKGRDAFQFSWSHLQAYAFPPFSLIGRVLKKVQADNANLIIITPAWQTQSWYPTLLQMSVQHPLLLPSTSDLLLNPNNEYHPLILNKGLRLVAWTVSGKGCLQRVYQEKLYHLSQLPGERVQHLITNRPGVSGTAGVLGDRLIPLEDL